MRKAKAICRNAWKGAVRIMSGNGLDPLPIRGPLRRYNTNKLRYDFKAAINIALLALPQGMAYAAIAELPIYYGIICSAICAIISPFFASSRFTILGPTNATAFMVFSFFAASQANLVKAPVEYMPLLLSLIHI